MFTMPLGMLCCSSATKSKPSFLERRGLHVVVEIARSKLSGNPRHAKRDCRLHPDFLRIDAPSLFTFFGLEDACLSQLHPSKKYPKLL
jgi:hypothetical protein